MEGPKLPCEVASKTDLTTSETYFQITNVHSGASYPGSESWKPNDSSKRQFISNSQLVKSPVAVEKVIFAQERTEIGGIENVYPTREDRL